VFRRRKVMVSVYLPLEVADKLWHLARERNTNMSAYIRELVLKHLEEVEKREKGNR